MRDFDYLRPATIAEASALLAEHGDNARMIAGGTALLLALRQRMVTPAYLISLAGIRALRGITYDDRLGLRIGALTQHAEVAHSALVRGQLPMLADMAGRLANPQVRNQGTIGGNLCYADPATDPPTCLIALDASVVVASTRGERLLPIEDFLVDYYTTALAVDEIVTEIRIPPPCFDAGFHARFLRTAAEHRPLVNFAMTVRRAGDVCQSARLVVGASTPIPIRCCRAEAYLAGKAMTGAVAQEAAAIVAEDITPISDMRGSAEFRRDMARVVACRTIAHVLGIDMTERDVA